MSYQYHYYPPVTPPGAPLRKYAGNTSHSRHTSDPYSINSSPPWSATTSTTSPGGSPPRKHHHGPTLLPKVRPQDVVVEPTPVGGRQQNRRVLSSTRNPSGFEPYPSSCPLSIVDSSSYSQFASPGAPRYTSCNGSALLSPVSIKSSTHSQKRKASSSPECPPRSVSGSDIDGTTLSRYGYPTYRQLPKYSAQPQTSLAPSATPNIVVHPPYAQQYLPEESFQPPQMVSSEISQSYYPHALSVGMVQCPDDVNMPSTTLLSYLTAPNQAIKLVRNVNVVPTRGMHDYFWWDIRNLRSWSSFSLETFNSISGLTKLLKTDIPSGLTPPTMVHATRLAPECEPALIDLIRDIYAPRVNAALAVSQGPNHLRLYPAPTVRTSVNKNYGNPHFLANYASDTEQTSSGLPRGRLVGIIKSFDRWNTGMRNEAPPRRVEYLNGLAHLQRCMREHSCRYGFIMTEIELVCVRAGCDVDDDVPYFGFLEVSTPIPTKLASFGSSSCLTSDGYDRLHSPTPSIITDNSSSASSRRSRSRSSSHSPMLPRHNLYSSAFSSSEKDGLNTPMTTTLALYFLLMLSKSVPLPSQPSSHLNVGGPGALTRQRILPEKKDTWIPEPQIGERRDAKRVRGWVWPQDAWHRREGGGVSRGGGKSAGASTSTSTGTGSNNHNNNHINAGGAVGGSSSYDYGYEYVYDADGYAVGIGNEYGRWYT